MVRKVVARKVVARKVVARKVVARKVVARKVVARKVVARKVVARKVVARRPAARKVVKAVAKKPAPKAARTPAPRTAMAPRAGAGAVVQATKASRRVTRKPPTLDRSRRTAPDDDVVPSPPSSLNFDRSASSARSGRRELLERFDEHTETGPAITAGDVDADWESAYSVGDEAPGGDNPTPDQDVVDDIGRAIGVEYEDREELKGEAKIVERDLHRWELDPASSDDYEDR
jgi:hypothetical protein